MLSFGRYSKVDGETGFVAQRFHLSAYLAGHRVCRGLEFEFESRKYIYIYIKFDGYIEIYTDILRTTYKIEYM